MPSRPPGLHGRPKQRKPWQASKEVDRLRGSAGVRDRRAILMEEPLCRACKDQGRVTASVQVDHIVPLSEGGSDQRSNKQAVCVPCHEAKTRVEQARGRARLA